MKDIPKLKVAIVHDWLVGGGAERVVLELHHMFPEAPIYTSYCTEQWRQQLDGKVVTGWLQRFGKLRKFMVLGRIWWFSHLDLSGYDLVISSSGNGEAFGVRVPKTTTHICYCHSPTHYYWRHYDQYMRSPGFGWFNPLARLGLRLLVGPLRRWDKQAARRVDYFIANSTHIQQDIQMYYERNSVVIYPPVDIERFSRTSQVTRRGFVTMGRQVPYKHTDLIIKACTQLNVPLKVIGRGPEHERLVRLGGPGVTFLTDVSDAAMPAELAGAEAFLFAAFEDFGVSPVEALASGTPVIAYHAGGALDYVVPGKTGEFFSEQTVSSLQAALADFRADSYNHTALAATAQQFSVAAFRTHLEQFLGSITADRQ